MAGGLAITVGAASKLIDRMEALELVERRANPSDRRSALLSLTTTGERERLLAERVTSAALSAHLDGGDVDVAAMVNGLEALRKRLEVAA